MCKTIKHKVRFAAPPAAVYPLLASQLGVRSPSPESVGKRFSNSDASGIIVDLLSPCRIVQAWRSEAFPEGVYSMAAFVLAPAPKGGSELTLIHRGVPKSLIPQVETRWREHYWSRIRELVQRSTGR